MPPMMSTSVMPVAITASAGMRFASVTKVGVVRKLSLNAPKSRTSPIQMTSRPPYSASFVTRPA